VLFTSGPYAPRAVARGLNNDWEYVGESTTLTPIIAKVISVLTMQSEY
jgi:hypothetical protein